MLKAAPELFYLGDMFSDGGGYKLAVATRCKCSWEVLPTATASHQPQSADSDRRLDVFNMREKCDAACRHPRFYSVLSRQRMKLVQTPFCQSLASRGQLFEINDVVS